MKRQFLMTCGRFASIVAAILLQTGCGKVPDDPDVTDEAMAQGKTKEDFPTHPWNNFHEMDGGALPSADDAQKGGAYPDREPVEAEYSKPSDAEYVPLESSQPAVKGRNSWLMWTGGNQAFWDHLARHSYGLIDLLRILDTERIPRDERFARLGLINEPGMREVNKPDPYSGLYLDVVKGSDAKGPTGSNSGYYEPGKESDEDYIERDSTGSPWVPDPDVYGYSSGVMGLRLFKNPNFDKQAAQKWDAERYREDESYAKDPDLVRPYRVGMACSFCHVAFNPLDPPQDPANPEWENLMSNIGNQYFKFGRVFGANVKRRSNALWHLLNYPEPGSLDTSLLATDGINNPNTMNSVFNVLPRIKASLKAPTEEVSKDTMAYPVLEPIGLPGGGTLDLPQGPERKTPHILAGGADSIGARGALSRVYLNIGEFHQQWIRNINLMVGVQPQDPFKIKDASDRSVYWRVSRRRSQNMARFFVQASNRKRLANAEGELLFDTQAELAEQLDNGNFSKAASETFSKQQYPVSTNATVEVIQRGNKWRVKDPNRSWSFIASQDDSTLEVHQAGDVYLSNDKEELANGKEVFATHCFVCHSSKQPEGLGFWRDPSSWKKWLQNPEYIKQAKKMVQKDDFLKGNYLSTDQRYKVTDIGINLARFAADNAREGHIWEDFSSIDFKEQSMIEETVRLQHPYDRDETFEWSFSEDVGPGRVRPLTLCSIWSTAPFLHNNAVGEYPGKNDPADLMTPEQADVSVAGRMQVFRDSIHKLLGMEGRRGFDSIVRTTEPTQIIMTQATLLDFVERQFGGFLKVLMIGLLVLVLLLGIYFVLWGIIGLRERRNVKWGKVVLMAVGWLFVIAFLWLRYIKVVNFWVALIVFLIGAAILLPYFMYRGRSRNLAWRLNSGIIVFGLVLIAFVGWLKYKDVYKFGYIPEGTPVNLVFNLNGPGWYTDSVHEGHNHPDHTKLIKKVGWGLLEVGLKRLPSLDHPDVPNLVPNLLKLNKCPDFVQDKGHTFGDEPVFNEEGEVVMRELTPQEKRDLIEYLKTM